MLEQIVAWFYIPWVFWSVPLLLAIGVEIHRRWPVLRRLRGRHRA